MESSNDTRIQQLAGLLKAVVKQPVELKPSVGEFGYSYAWSGPIP